MIISEVEGFPRIAVLMTCFNRRQTTLRCLAFLSELPEKVEVFLVDDRSSDGTADAVRQEFSAVHLIAGSGDLFWNRGMCLAWKTALPGDFDFYLLLNDDVKLYPDAIRDLLADSMETGHKAILSGAMKSPDSDAATYGGISIATGRLAQPDGTLQKIRNLNGNFVLVPRDVVQKIGIFDPCYHHHFGDVDYGMTAQERGIDVLLAKRYAGECAPNPIVRIRRDGVSLKRRFQILHSPLGTAPASVFRLFRKHGNPLKGIFFILYLYGINLMPDRLYHRIAKKK